jgi:hypothetical protein
VKSSVCANTQLDTFDKVVATYRTFIESKKHHTREQKINMNVSQLGSFSRGGNGNCSQQIKKIGADEDGYDPSSNHDAHKVDNSRYYQTNEWNNLNKCQRNYLRKNSRGANKRGNRRSSTNVNSRRYVNVQRV